MEDLAAEKVYAEQLQRQKQEDAAVNAAIKNSEIVHVEYENDDDSSEDDSDEDNDSAPKKDFDVNGDNDERLYAIHQAQIKEESKKIASAAIMHVDYQNMESSDEEVEVAALKRDFSVTGDNDEQLFAAMQTRIKMESAMVKNSSIIPVEFDNEESSDDGDDARNVDDVKHDFNESGDSDEQVYAAMQARIKRESELIKNSAIVKVDYENDSSSGGEESEEIGEKRKASCAKLPAIKNLMLKVGDKKLKDNKKVGQLAVAESDAKQTRKAQKVLSLAVGEKAASTKKPGLKLGGQSTSGAITSSSPYVYSKEPGMVYGARSERVAVYEADEKLPEITITKLSGQEKKITPGMVRGGSVQLGELKDCKIVILDHCREVTITDCSGCEVFIGAVEFNMVISRCSNCSFTLACMQLKMENSKDCLIQAFVGTYGMLEGCSNLTFTELNTTYNQSADHFTKANLEKDSNFWNIISDGSEGDKGIPEPHFTLNDEKPPLRTMS